jgi:hypothetical protein
MLQIVVSSHIETGTTTLEKLNSGILLPHDLIRKWSKGNTMDKLYNLQISGLWMYNTL